MLSVNLVAFLSTTVGLDEDCLFFNCFSYHSLFYISTYFFTTLT